MSGMYKSYYDLIHKCWCLLKNSDDKSLIIKGRMYKIEGHKLYKYFDYKWLLCPLTSFKKHVLPEFYSEFKKVLGVIEDEKEN